MTEHDILSDAEREALSEVMLAPPEAERCVLIVEDDPLSRELLAEFLALHGIECATASSEVQALALLECGLPIGMMLTDLRMEPHDGLHLIRTVRDSAEWAELPIIIMSGDAGVRDAIEAMHLNVVDFLLKPIDPAKLLELINRTLNL
ncbi:response regulator [Pseudomonas sp. 7P_10.2_Bac1]|uniref:response regulator n=1 Tax=Pseudomonas sp. 7P_10.2_Bac1 TaxID=2971614 RepID=UPI0021C5A80F|nr:response regulator [Pseudomonas sp. 7P_10.2_Bac1]MCU1726506.1 response regulator [Pseudomonas sp. 7P_10.2_Bac1]